MNTTHLIGAEQVERAGYNIQSAAETTSRAAAEIDSAAHRMAGQLETHGYQMESLATAMASAPTLHDQMAMAAMQGLLSQCMGTAFSSSDEMLELGAKFAYRMADAMMKAREA